MSGALHSMYVESGSDSADEFDEFLLKHSSVAVSSDDEIGVRTGSRNQQGSSPRLYWSRLPAAALVAVAWYSSNAA